MGKRQRGYGAVYHRLDGRWEGQIRIPGGGRRSFYGQTRRDVIHRLSQERWALVKVCQSVQERRPWRRSCRAGLPSAQLDCGPALHAPTRSTSRDSCLIWAGCRCGLSRRG